MSKRLVPDSIIDFRALSLTSVPNLHLASTKDLIAELDSRVEEFSILSIESYRRAGAWLDRRLEQIKGDGKKYS